MAAGERRHEPGGIGLPAQRQGRQLQPGGPPLGAGGQRRHRRFRQGRAGYGRPLPQQRRRLVRGEPQLRGAQFGQLAAAPQPGQRQWRVGAAGQHQVQSRRPVLEQEPERGVHGLGVNQVVVVEHQQRLVRIGPGGQLVDQRGHQPLVRRGRGRAEQRAHSFGEPRPGPGPARPHHGARIAPGRYRRRPATATPPAAGRAAPSRPAGPSCRTPPGRRPASARAPGPHPGVPPTAGAALGPGAARAHATWWPARHPARRPPAMGPRRAAQPCPPPCPVSPPATAHDERECDGTSVPSPPRKIPPGCPLSSDAPQAGPSLPSAHRPAQRR